MHADTPMRPIMVALMTAVFLSSLNQTMVVMALPDIINDLGTVTEVSWVVTAYLVTSTVFVPLWGKLSDIYGRRRLYQIAVVAFAVGSAWAGVAWAIEPLVAARALQGAGGGGILALSHTILGDLVTPRERGRHLAWLGSVAAIAGIAGPLLGGALVDQLSWRWVFLVNLPFVAVALWLVTRFLHVPFARDRSQLPTRVKVAIDYGGAILLTISVLVLLLVTSLGGTDALPWGSPRVALLAAVALGCLAGFVWTERRADDPIMPPSLFADRVFTVTILLGAVLGAAMHGALFLLPLLFQSAMGHSATAAGLWLLPLVAGFVVTTLVSGRLIARWGRYRAFPRLGTALMAVALLMLSRTGVGTGAAWILAGMVILGLGIGSLMHVITLVAQNAVPDRHLGTATSTAKFGRSLGAALGVAAVAVLVTVRFRGALDAPVGGVDSIDGALDEQTVAGLPGGVVAILEQAVADAIGFAFTALFVLALVGLVLALVLEERPLATEVRVDPDDSGARGTVTHDEVATFDV